MTKILGAFSILVNFRQRFVLHSGDQTCTQLIFSVIIIQQYVLFSLHN